MAKLLYLVHRMPYPPNKGDKVRSYHLLKHLAQRHQVFVGTFIDDPDDAAHIATLRGLCAQLHVAPLQPLRARIASLGALLHGQPLTLRYYRDAGLRRWVQRTVREQRIDAVVVFSSSMAQYAQGLGLPLLVDAAVREMLSGCNHAWNMYPDLLHGAYETLKHHGSEELKSRYLADIRARQLVTFVLAAVLAGLSGLLYVQWGNYITPTQVGLLQASLPVIWVAVGGRGTLIGPIVGAFLVNGAKSWLTVTAPEFWLYFLGALFIGVTLFLPDGVVGLVKKFRKGGKA